MSTKDDRARRQAAYTSRARKQMAERPMSEYVKQQAKRKPAYFKTPKKEVME